ncbi:type II toxin-antitoxin system HicA family toxin [Aphanothece sacrum]|uniref:Type II toxin-antitoxin system HicA family toxin n=1 Tax=Aphanothece sacrum FPU1 TaxID=1920663 RepID=A0A401IHW0_APHSA|nr:type II toxin-antitoxin system HicA family toxin [Aphanothece sacrum]GBF80786.1 hypothetical protein AsFPU1_2191 [Aphanothece sacrum FPU1]GBF83281.1 hypothetical protein AsFPU3_0321 [Aphanothece sacrum FPU3]
MNYPKIRYRELEKVILSLNFISLSTEGTQKVFEHPSGALIILPDYSENQEVSPTHIAAIARILDEFNIMNKLDFETFLENSLSFSTK